MSSKFIAAVFLFNAKLNLIIQLCTIEPTIYFTKNIFFQDCRVFLIWYAETCAMWPHHTRFLLSLMLLSYSSINSAIEPTSARPILKSSAS